MDVQLERRVITDRRQSLLLGLDRRKSTDKYQDQQTIVDAINPDALKDNDPDGDGAIAGFLDTR